MPTSQYVQQAEAILKAAQAGNLPEHLQASAEESLAKTRQATRNSFAAARDGADIVEQALRDTRTLTEKALQNVGANTEAAFDAAQAMLRAKDVTEAAQSCRPSSSRLRLPRRVSRARSFMSLRPS
jgi:hypothetical protein